MDSEEDTEPRKFFCFDGCMIKMDKNILEVEVPILQVYILRYPNWMLKLLFIADVRVDERIRSQRHVQVYG